MAYRFATEAADHSDLASGRVIHGLPGHPAFPVRLADEVLRRCLALRESDAPCTIYDPCCGAAYHLAVMDFLHRPSIRGIVASDVDPAVLGTAERNLALLGVDGMDARIRELEELRARHGKDSHREALESARRLRARVATSASGPLATRVFRANALDGNALQRELAGAEVDLVFADVPYGWSSRWEAAEGTAPGADAPPALWSLLDALRGVVSPATIVAIASDKAQKAAHEGYRRLERFQVGRRRIVFLAVG